MKRHAHYCPIARALDLLGDRWTLLVVRELGFGEQRFSELRRHLVGISPTLLTERLQALRTHGLVTRTLAETAARARYALTPKGREALPIIRAMARFGMALLPSARRAGRIRAETAALGAVSAFYDAEAGRGIDERYRLIVDGTTFDLASARGGTTSRTGAPDLVLTGSARALVAARRGETSLDDAIADGSITAAGSTRALTHFKRVFRLEGVARRGGHATGPRARD